MVMRADRIGVSMIYGFIRAALLLMNLMVVLARGLIDCLIR